MKKKKKLYVLAFMPSTRTTTVAKSYVYLKKVDSYSFVGGCIWVKLLYVDLYLRPKYKVAAIYQSVRYQV